MGSQEKKKKEMKVERLHVRIYAKNLKQLSKARGKAITKAILPGVASKLEQKALQ